MFPTGKTNGFQPKFPFFCEMCDRGRSRRKSPWSDHVTTARLNPARLAASGSNGDIGAMRQWQINLLIVPVLVLSPAVVVCGERSQPIKSSRVTVYPKAVRLAGHGQRQRLVVTGSTSADGQNRRRDLGRQATYRAEPAGVVEVTGDGELIARKSGTAVVRVSAGGGQAEVSVLVHDGETHRPVDFTNDINPLLTRLGCNGGSCHGKSTGRGGFRLSLFGHHPEWDFEWIAQGGRGRRIFPAAPDQSLLLRKPTMQMPHGGGRRMAADSDAYRLLRRWVSEGAGWGEREAARLLRIEVFPAEATLRSEQSQQLAVTAVFEDGTTSDVTRVVELRTNDSSLVEIDEAGLVTAGRRTGQTAVIALLQGRVAVSRLTVPLETPRAQWPEFPIANLVDRHVERNLKILGVAPSAVCDDATFLRRVSLHLAGRIPRPEDVESFLADAAGDKREKLVQRLLASPEYADTFAQKWSALLRNKRRGQKDRIPGTITFHRWIRNAIAQGMPYDRFVRQILTATGNVSVSPPVQWYAEVRYLDRYVDDTAQVFLGLRIGCARCHHHPFENFTQTDYYGLAAFFTRVDRREGTGVAERRANETVLVKASGSVKHPVTGEVVKPHGLGGPELDLPPYADPRHRLVDWMSEPGNPYFARAFVNRMWAHCFGRGLVEPIDDLRVTNPATNPALLEALAGEFVASGFDMRHVLKIITTSTTYQLDSSANVDNLDEIQGHSRFYPQRLSAEMLLDSIDQVTSRPTSYSGLPNGTRAMQLPDEDYSNQFLKLFGRPPRESACECERAASPSLSQSLFTLNDSFLLGKIFDPKSSAAKLAVVEGDHATRVRRLFLVALSRPATTVEIEKAVKYIGSETDAKTAYSNLMWELINTKEFQYNH